MNGGCTQCVHRLVLALDINRPGCIQIVDHVQSRDCHRGQEVTHPGTCAHADYRTDSGSPRGTVQFQHVDGRLPVVADVEIVSPGLDRCLENADAETEERSDRIDDHVCAVKQFT